MIHIFHKWPNWSEPKQQMYYQAPNPMYGTVGGDVLGYIQVRTCAICGRYQWRKV